MTEPPLSSNVPLSLISTIRVPNEPPTVEVPYRLAIVGEAPGADEEAYGRPFIGASGRLLDNLLGSVGIMRAGCFVGNVCKYRPPGNEIKAFGYSHPKVLEGWEELKNELHNFQPNCILALGNTPLHFLAGRSGVTSWRGSILATPYGKVVAAIHPAAVLREYKQWVLLRFDALRARQESEDATLTLPQRTLELDLSADEICNRLDNWPAGQLLSFDIEGGLDAFPCCSVAGTPNHGFIIAWSRHSEVEQGRIASSLSCCLYSNAIPKCLQNSLYDRFVLAYGYNILIRNVHEDTMLKQWEVYPELPKGLGTIASIWTREPFYKFERKADAQDDFYKYCIKDSCVTLEACNAQEGALSPLARRHYRFNMDLLDPLLYMELRGIRYDSALASSELAQVKAALSECSSRLELRAGYSVTGAKGSVSSTKLKKLLYQEKGYPEQKKGRGPQAKVTTDVVALLKLSKKFPNDALLADILLHRKLESIQETLEIQTDPDGRVRCGYNLVGTETGRLTCYTSPTGSGANLQTITKKLRKLYVADEECWFFQCDLSGADGWTVAAHCLRHGDSTMWDDYTFGLKPARIIALMYEHGPEATNCDRATLKERCKNVDDNGWLYFACKRIQHASNYGVKETTGTEQIMEDSYKITGSPIYVSKEDFLILQRFYFLRYPGIYQWHEWAKREVEGGRNITSASGHTRTFFGRRKSYNPKRRCVEADHETWKEFLADEPQENTTYATNLALDKLWRDPENARPVPLRHQLPSGSVLLNHHYVEPLHQVHDALNGLFPKSRTEWACGKIREWFQNRLQICETEVIIPFEGNYGPSWGELGEKYGGGTI
jgi:uracil-DNA glycosylase family 4